MIYIYCSIRLHFDQLARELLPPSLFKYLYAFVLDLFVIIHYSNCFFDSDIVINITFSFEGSSVY